MSELSSSDRAVLLLIFLLISVGFAVSTTSEAERTDPTVEERVKYLEGKVHYMDAFLRKTFGNKKK